MCTQCSLQQQCLMRLTQTIVPFSTIINGCDPKMKPSPDIGGMSLGRDQQPYNKQPDQRIARQKREAETRGHPNVNEGGASMRKVGRWRDLRLLIMGRLVFVDAE